MPPPHDNGLNCAEKAFAKHSHNKNFCRLKCFTVEKWYINEEDLGNLGYRNSLVHIRDMDIARETIAYTRNNQVAEGMLARTIPQGAPATPARNCPYRCF